MSSPSSSADWWATMPDTVMLRDWAMSTHGFRSRSTASTNSLVRKRATSEPKRFLQSLFAAWRCSTVVGIPVQEIIPRHNNMRQILDQAPTFAALFSIFRGLYCKIDSKLLIRPASRTNQLDRWKISAVAGGVPGEDIQRGGTKTSSSSPDHSG